MSSPPALNKIVLVVMALSATANLSILLWGYHLQRRMEDRSSVVSMPRILTVHQLPLSAPGVDVRCTPIGARVRMTVRNDREVPIYAARGHRTPGWYFNVDGSISLIQGMPPWIRRNDRTFRVNESVRLDPQQTWTVELPIQADTFGDPFVPMATDHGLPVRTSVYCLFAWVEWQFDQDHPTTEILLTEAQRYSISVPATMTFH